jgi:hypothetical protein
MRTTSRLVRLHDGLLPITTINAEAAECAEKDARLKRVTPALFADRRAIFERGFVS